MDGECSSEFGENVARIESGPDGFKGVEHEIEELKSFCAHRLVDLFGGQICDGAGGTAEPSVDEEFAVGFNVDGKRDGWAGKLARVPETGDARRFVG